MIIGGGLTGGCLAFALQSSGLKIAVVEAFTDEQRRASPAGNRALALANGSQRFLHQLGVWSGAKERAVPIKNIHISDRGHFGKTRLVAEEEGVDALGYVVTARILEDSISLILDSAGVERICPARLIGLQSGTDSVCVSLKQGEECLNLDVRLVVGADGGNSTVRRLVNISQQVRDYHQTAIITVVKPEIEPNFTAFERFTSSGPLALLPTENESCSVVWTQTSESAESVMALSEKAFIEKLQSAFGYWLGALKCTASRGSFPLKLVQANRIISERTVLIGNAVHQLHPIAGQGLNLGIRDVAALAEMIINQCAAGKDPGASELLQRYAKIRNRDHQRVISFTDGLISIFSNNWIPVVAARNAGLLALDCLPWAKHLMARHTMGLDGRLPRLTPSGLA